MADQSFFVHLQSLQDFAQELKTQLGGMATPIDHLTSLGSTPVLLGTFGEASALGSSHQAAVMEMSQLLGEVQQAIEFAENITNTVATGYQQADSDVADGMQVQTNQVAGGNPVGQLVDGLWNTLTGQGGQGQGGGYGAQHGGGFFQGGGHGGGSFGGHGGGHSGGGHDAGGGFGGHSGDSGGHSGGGAGSSGGGGHSGGGHGGGHSGGGQGGNGNGGW